MPLHRTIYYHDKPLVLTTDAADYCRAHPLAAGFLRFEGAFPRHYRLALRHLEKAGTIGALVEDESPGALLEGIHERFKPVNAGGGVVWDEAGAVLMIYRRGRWDLPKGKQDPGERIDATALREVQEETGLGEVRLGAWLCDTYHIYTHKGTDLLKTTSWYAMHAPAGAPLQPQAEEAILEARWMDAGAIQNILSKTYEAIRGVLRTAGALDGKRKAA